MAELWGRIAKIAGMLGSDQDGERLAAVRKIDALLKTAKLGWSDFAGRIANGEAKEDPWPYREHWSPPPKPKRQAKPKPKKDPNIGRAGYPFWRTNVDRLSVWARCLTRTERGIQLQMSHRAEPEWLPRRYVWRNYPQDQPPPLDEEWQEWSIERWIVEKEHLADVML